MTVDSDTTDEATENPDNSAEPVESSVLPDWQGYDTENRAPADSSEATSDTSGASPEGIGDGVRDSVNDALDADSEPESVRQNPQTMTETEFLAENTEVRDELNKVLNTKVPPLTAEATLFVRALMQVKNDRGLELIRAVRQAESDGMARRNHPITHNRFNIALHSLIAMEEPEFTGMSYAEVKDAITIDLLSEVMDLRQQANVQNLSGSRAEACSAIDSSTLAAIKSFTFPDANGKPVTPLRHVNLRKLLGPNGPEYLAGLIDKSFHSKDGLQFGGAVILYQGLRASGLEGSEVAKFLRSEIVQKLVDGSQNRGVDIPSLFEQHLKEAAHALTEHSNRGSFTKFLQGSRRARIGLSRFRYRFNMARAGRGIELEAEDEMHLAGRVGLTMAPYLFQAGIGMVRVPLGITYRTIKSILTGKNAFKGHKMRPNFVRRARMKKEKFKQRAQKLAAKRRLLERRYKRTHLRHRRKSRADTSNRRGGYREKRLGASADKWLGKTWIDAA